MKDRDAAIGMHQFLDIHPDFQLRHEIVGEAVVRSHERLGSDNPAREKRSDKKHTIQEGVRKVCAGHLTDVRHAPCIFPASPCIPPREKALSHHISYSTTISKNTTELERLEEVIRENIGSFCELGHALAEIRGQGTTGMCWDLRRSRHTAKNGGIIRKLMPIILFQRQA